MKSYKHQLQLFLTKIASLCPQIGGAACRSGAYEANWQVGIAPLINYTHSLHEKPDTCAGSCLPRQVLGGGSTSGGKPRSSWARCRNSPSMHECMSRRWWRRRTVGIVTTQMPTRGRKVVGIGPTAPATVGYLMVAAASQQTSDVIQPGPAPSPEVSSCSSSEPPPWLSVLWTRCAN